MNANDVIIRANCGIIGIDEDLSVFGGYDQQIYAAGAITGIDRSGWDDEDDEMPREEKLILADRMIALWQRYKQEAT